ncbi:unnamed protein product [Gadus morhua 'NCC']
MKTFALVFVFLILAAVCTDANPIMKESVAKQPFRSKRQVVIIIDANPIMKESVAKQLFRSKRQDNPYEWGIMLDLIKRCWEQKSVPVMV